MLSFDLMKTIKREELIDLVASLCIKANLMLPKHQKEKLEWAFENETSPLGKKLISQIIENYRIAEKTGLAICQDCGLAVIFLEAGRDVHLDFDIYKAINEGVVKGYSEGHLRPSVLHSCVDRTNTKTNTPAIIHTQIVDGDKITLTVAPKGGGSENASRLAMLKPYEGWQGIVDFVVKTVRENGPSACPPVTVGIGLGGTMEECALLAKKALLAENRSEELGDMEKEILDLCNNLGFGPAGLGGKISVLDVHILSTGCHIATMPVAVNIQCHAARKATGEI